MTDRPAQSADWHARRGEDLARLANSASMAGWFKRGKRRELLAAAQVHASLGAAAMPTGAMLERLATAEAEAEAADARASDLASQLADVKQALGDYGQDLLEHGQTPSEAVQRLMARVYNDE